MLSQLSWLDAVEIAGNTGSYFARLLEFLDVTDDAPGWPDRFGSTLYEWLSAPHQAHINTLSLFSGGGGLDIAFHDAGFNIIQAIELEPKYVETLRENAKEGGRLYGAEVICTDIRDYRPPQDLRADFIIGGPPCQTFSAAGRRAAGVSGLDDPRGTLFEEYVRILQDLQPRGFLFENVYGIIGAQGGRAWKEITRAFATVGYEISFRILDAADYGAPQQRERLIIVGTHKGGFNFPRPTHGPDSSDGRPEYAAGLAVSGISDEKPKPIGGRFGHLLHAIPPGLNYSFYTEEMGHPTPLFAWRSKFSDLLYKADPMMPVRTIKAQGGQYTGPFHWDNRPFSVGELKRLQTFPDDYTLVGGRQVAIRQLGNSVPPQFGRMLALAIRDQIFGLGVPSPLEYLSEREELGFRRRKAQLTALYKRKAKEALSNDVVAATFDSAAKGIARDKVASSTWESSEETTLIAYLGPRFSWHVKSAHGRQYPWNLAASITKQEHCISISARSSEHESAEPDIIIEIRPNGRWQLPVDQVVLEITECSPHLFTGAWKALEHYVAQKGVKADLVQLNGYYQYDPRIKSTIKRFARARTSAEDIDGWVAVRHVVEGSGVRRMIGIDELGKLWEMSPEATIESLVLLRSMGYEVRSEYTNDQIPEGTVLIPYAFPTLTPQSVQLRKTLFPESVLHGSNLGRLGGASERETTNRWLI